MMRAVKRKNERVQTPAEWEMEMETEGKRTQTIKEAGSDSDLLGRIVVAAGIFLLLFFTGRLPREPSEETVRAWISSDSAYEMAVEHTATWIEDQFEKEK